jgi:hypothetical protein
MGTMIMVATEPMVSEIPKMPTTKFSRRLEAQLLAIPLGTGTVLTPQMKPSAFKKRTNPKTAPATHPASIHHILNLT